MKRAFGIETEYGITVEGLDDFDVVHESIEELCSKRMRPGGGARRSVAICTLLAFGLAGCATVSSDDIEHFSARPNGGDPLRKSSGRAAEAPIGEITAHNFTEITVAQGSGLAGYDSVRVLADGTGYAVVGNRHDEYFRVPISLTRPEMADFFRAMNQDRLPRLKGVYSAGIDDGVQGFVVVTTKVGSLYTYFDNFFLPIAHTYEFCNEHIWAKLKQTRLQGVHPRRVSGSSEYSRVHP